MSQGPLNFSLGISQAKTEIPLFKDGVMVHLRLQEITQSTVEGKGNVLTFKWTLVDPAMSNDDATQIQPGAFGSQFFDRIQCYAKPDAKDPKWFEKKIASRIDALLGTGDPDNKKNKPPRPDLSPELVPELIGKDIFALMKVRTGEFTGNEMDKLFNPAELQQHMGA